MAPEQAQATLDTRNDHASTLEPGDVLCDRHRHDWYVITDIDDGGVGLRDTETEYMLPDAVFCSIYGR